MTALPSEGAPQAQTTADNSPTTSEAVDQAGGTKENICEPAATEPVGSAGSPEPPRRTLGSVLMPTLVTFYSIGIALWLIFAWSGYDTKYSQTTDSWKLNSTKMIEITLIGEDKVNLACASDANVHGLHCGYNAQHQKVPGEVDTDPQLLQPYNTVANELFLGAGLWTNPVLKGPLPGQRFTVMCNYKVLGAAKNVSLRWGVKAAFDPLKNSVAVGSLSDCVIPQ
jgi:hypothetical protein